MSADRPTWRTETNAYRNARLAEVAKAGLAEKTPEAIAACAEAAEQRRLERERYWLEQERAALNGRKSRPLSRMPA